MKIKNLDFHFTVIDTIGDGSCFLHAVLQAFNKEYLESDMQGRMKMVQELRKDLALVLDVEEDNQIIYNKLSRGEIGELSQVFPELKKEVMQKHLASRNWLNIIFLEMISTLLDINIIIISQKEKDFYYTGDPEIYFKERDTIYINYIDEAHFETLGVITPSGVRTLFHYDEDLVQKSLKIIKGSKYGLNKAV